MTDRRRWGRREYAGGHLPPAARLRPGPPVVVVNLSRNGALVEGHLRPRAGSTCAFEFSSPHGTVSTGARVVRCFVSRLEAASVRYRAALVFETLVPAPADSDALAGYPLPTALSSPCRDGVVITRERRDARRPWPSRSASHEESKTTRWHRP